jgi:hypothetical protein
MFYHKPHEHHEQKARVFRVVGMVRGEILFLHFSRDYRGKQGPEGAFAFPAA